MDNTNEYYTDRELAEQARRSPSWGIWRGILQGRFPEKGLTDDELLMRYRALPDAEQDELRKRFDVAFINSARAKATAKEKHPEYAGFSKLADTLAMTLPHPSIWAAMIINLTVKPFDIKHFWHTVVMDFDELAENADDSQGVMDYLKEAAHKGKSYAQIYQDTERNKNAAYLFRSLTALGDVRTPPDDDAPPQTQEQWSASRREEEGIATEQMTEETTRTNAYLVLLCLKARGIAEETNLSPLAEGNGYNALCYAKWNTKNPTEEHGELTPIDIADGSRQLTTVYKDTVLLYDKYQGETNLWRPSAKKLMDFATMKFTRQNNAIKRKPLLPLPDNEPDPRIKHSVVFDVGDFLASTHQKEANVVRGREGERIKEDLECIFRTHLTFTDYRIVTRKGKDGKLHQEQKLQRWAAIHIASAVDYDDTTGKVTINFSPEMAKSLLCYNYITQYDTRLLKCSEHNESYVIGRKLQEHYCNNKNRRRGTNNLISCKALYEVSQLPSEEKLRADYDRPNLKQKMLAPFLKALGELEKDIGLQWNFCREGRQPLREKDKPGENIKDFMKCYIRFELRG